MLRRSRVVRLIHAAELKPPTKRAWERTMHLSPFQVDGDRMKLQERGILDVYGRDFHSILWLRSIDDSDVQYWLQKEAVPEGDDFNFTMDMVVGAN